MINSLEEISKLLVGTELETSSKVELYIPESTKRAFAIKVKPENRFDAWRLLRALLDETQRYPVLAGVGFFTSDTWAEKILDENMFSRQEFQCESECLNGGSSSPEAFIKRAKTVDVKQRLEQQQQTGYILSLEEKINIELNRTLARFGIAPARETIPTFPSEPTDAILRFEEWLFAWELEHLDPEVALAPPDLEYLDLDWHESPGEIDHTLVLLPTPYSWETLAYLHWFGAASSSTVIALLKSWHERFKAELVAHDGLMLLFNVYQRPSTPKEAFQLAVEQVTFAGSTLYLPGISIRDHARALLHIDRWCLLDKP